MRKSKSGKNNRASKQTRQRGQKIDKNKYNININIIKNP